MRNAAREAVKHNIRAEGLKVQHFPLREISAMADQFVENNRDKLLAGALRLIERSPELQRMLEREQREWAKRLVKSGHFLDQSVDTSPITEQVSQ